MAPRALVLLVAVGLLAHGATSRRLQRRAPSWNQTQDQDTQNTEDDGFPQQDDSNEKNEDFQQNTRQNLQSQNWELEDDSDDSQQQQQQQQQQQGGDGFTWNDQEFGRLEERPRQKQQGGNRPQFPGQDDQFGQISQGDRENNQQTREQQTRDQQTRDQQNRDQQNRDQQNRDQQNRDQQNGDQENRDQQGWQGTQNGQNQQGWQGTQNGQNQQGEKDTQNQQNQQGGQNGQDWNQGGQSNQNWQNQGGQNDRDWPKQPPQPSTPTIEQPEESQNDQHNGDDHKFRPGPQGTPDGYTTLHNFRSSAYYKFYSQGVTWVEAVARCASEGARVAVPRSKEEAVALGSALAAKRKAIKGAIDKNYVYLGFTDLATENVFYTLDGEEVNNGKTSKDGAIFANWQKGEPNNAGKRDHCGQMNEKGLYWDGLCTEKRAFFCKYEGGLCKKNLDQFTDDDSQQGQQSQNNQWQS